MFKNSQSLIFTIIVISLLAISNIAHAGGLNTFTNAVATAELSAGCASINATPSDNFWGNGYEFSAPKNMIAGEVITITSGSGITQIVMNYGGGAAEVDVTAAPPPAQSFTVPSTGVNTFSVVVQGGTGTNTTFACTGAGNSESAGKIVNETIADVQTTQIIGSVFNHLNTLAAINTGNGGQKISLNNNSLNLNLSGVSAGSIASKEVKPWASMSYTHVKNSSTANPFNGDIINVQAGADYNLNPNLIAGLSLGSSFVMLDDVGGSGGKYQENSISIVPYGQYKIDETFTISGLIGYAYGNVDQTNADTGATGNTNSSMWFASTRGGADIKIDDLTQVTGRINASYMTKGLNGFTDSASTANASTDDSETYSLSLGGEVRRQYKYNETDITPYLGGDYQLDFVNKTNGDKDAFLLSTGLRAEYPNGMFLTIDASTQLMRDDYESFTIGSRLNWPW